MSIALTSRPIKSGCNFNAVGNPVVYKLNRRDHAIAAINDASTFAQVQINGIDLTAYYQVGNSVYVDHDDYDTVGEITASSFSGGNTLITTNLEYISGGTGYVNNISKRTDYMVEVQVFIDEVLRSTLQFTPGNDGLIYCDVAGVVRPYLGIDWGLPSLGTSMLEEEGSVDVYITYQEYYDGGYIGSATDDSATPIHVVHAALQILVDPITLTQNQNGGNMLDYYPSLITPKKFLTRLTSPVIWRGWPFTLSFLWPDDVDQIRAYREDKDIDGNVVYQDVGFMTSELGELGRINVTSSGLGALHADAKTVEIKLQHTNPVGPVYTDITEVLVLQVQEPCKQIVHLFFKNQLGGDTFWQFQYNQEYNYAYSQGRKVQRMTLIAEDLTLEQWEALQDINSPSEVFPDVILDMNMDTSIIKTHRREDQQVYMVSQDGETKIGVIVIPTNTSTFTKNKKHTLEIQIELPEMFLA